MDSMSNTQNNQPEFEPFNAQSLDNNQTPDSTASFNEAPAATGASLDDTSAAANAETSANKKADKKTHKKSDKATEKAAPTKVEPSEAAKNEKAKVKLSLIHI